MSQRVRVSMLVSLPFRPPAGAEVLEMVSANGDMSAPPEKVTARAAKKKSKAADYAARVKKAKETRRLKKLAATA